jgi:hypothetical protein
VATTRREAGLGIRINRRITRPVAPSNAGFTSLSVEGSPHSQLVLARVRRQGLMAAGQAEASGFVQAHGRIVASCDPQFDGRCAGVVSPALDGVHQPGGDTCPSPCGRHPHRDQLDRRKCCVRSIRRDQPDDRPVDDGEEGDAALSSSTKLGSPCPVAVGLVDLSGVLDPNAEGESASAATRTVFRTGPSSARTRRTTASTHVSLIGVMLTEVVSSRQRQPTR